jgi:hypothetical protein
MPIYQVKASEERADFFDLIDKDVTFACEIIGISGLILHTKGEKAYISDVVYTPGYWSTLCPDIWVQPKISMFQINHVPGHWRPDTFVEFQTKK